MNGYAKCVKHDTYDVSANATKSGIQFTEAGLSERHAIDAIAFEIIGKITATSASVVAIDDETVRKALLDSIISNVQLTDRAGPIVDNVSLGTLYAMSRLLGAKAATWDLDPGFSDYPVTGTNEYNLRAVVYIPFALLRNPLLRTAFCPQVHQLGDATLEFTFGDLAWTDSNSVDWTVDSSTDVNILTFGRDEPILRLSHPIRYDSRALTGFDGLRASQPGLQLALALNAGAAAQGYTGIDRAVRTVLDGRELGGTFGDSTPFRRAAIYDFYGSDIQYDLDAAGYGIQKSPVQPLLAVRGGMTPGELADLRANTGAIVKLGTAWTSTKTFFSAVVRDNDFVGAGIPIVPPAIPADGPVALALKPFFPTALDR